VTWLVYTLIVLLLFTIIKVVNYQLNRMFDTNKIITSEKVVKQLKVIKKPSKTAATNASPANLHRQAANPINQLVRSSIPRLAQRAAQLDSDSNGLSTSFNLETSLGSGSTTKSKNQSNRTLVSQRNRFTIVRPDEINQFEVDACLPSTAAR
jgi:hypothetical protein